MKMFLYNYDKTTVVNTAHIIRMQLENAEMNPAYCGGKAIVGADLTYGTEIMYKGTTESCKMYMDDIYTRINAAN